MAENRACNAMEACDRFKCSAEELDAAWQKAKKVVKFGGGFYCGLVSMKSKELYVFNAFFMSMRSKFVGAGKSIYCYEVSFSPAVLGWAKFRGDVLGPTDPAEAPVGSLRKTILDDFKALGLTSEPNKGDNGVHASASPFEGLAEKINWLGRSVESDPFGVALLKAGLSKDTIQEWSVDPRITPAVRNQHRSRTLSSGLNSETRQRYSTENPEIPRRSRGSRLNSSIAPGRAGIRCR